MWMTCPAKFLTAHPGCGKSGQYPQAGIAGLRCTVTLAPSARCGQAVKPPSRSIGIQALPDPACRLMNASRSCSFASAPSSVIRSGKHEVRLDALVKEPCALLFRRKRQADGFTGKQDERLAVDCPARREHPHSPKVIGKKTRFPDVRVRIAPHQRRVRREVHAEGSKYVMRPALSGYRRSTPSGPMIFSVKDCPKAQHVQNHALPQLH